MKTKLAVLAVFLALVAGALVWRSSISKQEGHFFRLKVGLTYKNAPIDIDIVVGCGVHYSWSRAAGGSTDEVLGMTAYWFVTSMPDGHAIAIRTVPGVGLTPCRGDTTANGNISPRWMPFIVWFEREGEFAHGIGYRSQLAYENPTAQLGFRGATIEHANYADYSRFVATGRKNLWPPYLTNSMHGGRNRPYINSAEVRLDNLAKNPSSAWPYALELQCIGARRIRLDASQQAALKKDWPPDHPKFWGYGTTHEQLNAWVHFLKPDQRRDDDGSFYPIGVARDEDDPLLEIYPIRRDDALVELNPQTPGDNRYVESVLVDPALRGVMYCDFPAPPPLVMAVTHKPASVREDAVICRIGDYTFPMGSRCHDYDWVVFENDDHAIISETSVY